MSVRWRELRLGETFPKHAVLCHDGELRVLQYLIKGDRGFEWVDVESEES